MLAIVAPDGPHSNIWYSSRTRVLNFYQGFPPDAIYIGRGGRGHDGYFGNPILLTGKESREEVLERYERYLVGRLKVDKIFAARVKSLSGKTLVCFCIPKLCHGMILARYADNLNGRIA